MKSVALILLATLCLPTRVAAHPDTLVITAAALREGRVFARNIVLSVPGLDLWDIGAPRYTHDDDPAFAARDLVDSGWVAMDSTREAGFQRGQVYWVRYHLNVAPELARELVDLNIYYQGAIEVYHNGLPIERFGTLPDTRIGRSYEPADFVPRRKVSLHLALDGVPETIAVRYVVDPRDWLQTGGTWALLLSLNLATESDDLERLEDSTLLQYGIFFGINLLIALLAAVIVSRSRRDRSWLFLGLFSLFVALLAVTNIPAKGVFGLSLGTVGALDLFNSIVYPASLLFLVLVMRVMLDRLDRRSLWGFCALTLIMVIVSYLPYFMPIRYGDLASWIPLFFFFEVARQTVRAVRRKVYGSWIIGTGSVIFILCGVLLEQYFMFTGFEMSRWLRTFMRCSVYLTMPVTIAIFLAVRSAYHNRLLARQRDELDQEVHERTAELRHEKERSDQLLLNILPHEVAEELKDSGEAAAKHFDVVTILFTDFKGFTEASEKMSPQELVAELNTCFKAFDGIITTRGIEKIKTIGDAYMCASGLPDPKTSSPADVVHAALEMQAFMTSRKVERDAQGLPAFEMRVGIHTGPVVAGIVGVKKFQYDIWGDTVNTASRMESSGQVGQVNISESTHALVKNDPGFAFSPRGKVQAKGKGELEMYFVSKA